MVNETFVPNSGLSPKTGFFFFFFFLRLSVPHARTGRGLEKEGGQCSQLGGDHSNCHYSVWGLISSYEQSLELDWINYLF